MARTINRLNPLKVKALDAPGLHADGNGLYLSVSKTGAKSWALVYRWRNKRVELGLGPARAVTLAQARERAQDAASLRAQDIDPRQHWRRVEQGAPTFGKVALELIESRDEGWKNTKHRQQWRNTLKTYAAPIWERPIDAVAVDDLVAILSPIWRTKPETASRVRGRIEAVLDAAKVRGLRTGENPAAWRGNLALLMPKPRKGPKKHHDAMAFEDVPAFVARLRKLPGTSSLALELLILTAARTSEILEARWEEFDLDRAIWIVPAERMKAGKEHRVPLSKPAVDLLNSLTRTGPLVFPGADPERPMSNMAMAMLLRRMKCLGVTVHGFRSSFRDWAGETTTYPREIAEQALAHQVGNEVERAYRRGDALEQRRALMAEWSSFLLQIS
ncbi:site-specific integrase [Novosphingobium sp. Gsoil 351]|uniref:tyrosine-type recombinase/integrase n=1 Tax=Novosphingobium sp. Gsoil 351 TaxID=2675225 RepID=UPI0012B50106|nr:site-specific integrase [Novosphingobium sp. Gsoil 351]QGN54162.1 tyrosine-type recombinase/integrase [Novosphingobium sp. Gsoil 351]